MAFICNFNESSWEKKIELMLLNSTLKFYTQGRKINNSILVYDSTYIFQNFFNIKFIPGYYILLFCKILKDHNPI